MANMKLFTSLPRPYNFSLKTEGGGWKDVVQVGWTGPSELYGQINPITSYNTKYIMTLIYEGPWWSKKKEAKSLAGFLSLD